MEERLRAEGWHHEEHEGMIRHLGGLWHRRTAEGMATGFIAQPFHANRNGVVHGGMLMTVLDRAFGIMAREASGAARSATISLSHQFLIPLNVGTFASVEPRVLRLTGRMVFLEGSLRGDEGAVLQAQGVWRVMRAKD